MGYPTLDDLKAHLRITGTADDVLIASASSNAKVVMERDTGRTFSVSSNVTRRYSTDGASALVVHDMPYSDSSRVVTLTGVTMTQDTNYWLLPDRRNPDVATFIQLRYFGELGYLADPMWFDKNLDRYWRRGTAPNDLVIQGVIGHPDLTLDAKQAYIELTEWLYYREKAGASGTITTPTGVLVDLAEYPPTYQRFVSAWKIKTAVAVMS